TNTVHHRVPTRRTTDSPDTAGDLDLDCRRSGLSGADYRPAAVHRMRTRRLATLCKGAGKNGRCHLAARPRKLSSYNLREYYFRSYNPVSLCRRVTDNHWEYGYDKGDDYLVCASGAASGRNG